MSLAAVALSFVALVLTLLVQYRREKRTWLSIALAFTCVIASFKGEAGTLSWIACAPVL